MTPDPRILAAKTVADLIDVLNADPYRLGVPTGKDLPKGSALVQLWGASIAVTVDPQNAVYRADATLDWPLILDLTINDSTFLLRGLPGGASAIGKE